MRLGYNAFDGSPANRASGGTRVQHGFRGTKGPEGVDRPCLGRGKAPGDLRGGHAGAAAAEGAPFFVPLEVVAAADWRVGPVVYVLQGEAFPYFKIGSSENLKARWGGLRASTPGGVRCVAWWRVSGASAGRGWGGGNCLRAAEVDLQARLHRWLVSGEWFHATPESSALIIAWRDHGRPRPTRLYPAEPWGAIAWKGRRRWLAAFYAARGEGRPAREACALAEAACA